LRKCFVFDANTVSLFKAHWRKFWMRKDVKYDFTADLAELVTDLYVKQVDCSLYNTQSSLTKCGH